MKILVDGYNVMHKMKMLKPLLVQNLESARETFIEIVCKKARDENTNVRTVLVFDGKRGGSGAESYTLEHGKVKVMFSRPPQNADTLLTQLMDEERAPQNVLVVSSDNDVVYSAKHRSIKTQSSRAFAEKLLYGKQKGGKENPPISEGEIEYWLKVFGTRRK